MDVEGVYTAVSSSLTDYQFRLWVLLGAKSGVKGTFKASVAEICTLMKGSSDRTVRRALKALEEAGYLTVTRTRRANGFQGKNIYQIQTVTTVQTVTSDRPIEQIQTVTGDRTSLDKVIQVIPVVPTSIGISNTSNTSSTLILEKTYHGASPKAVPFKKEIRIPMKKYDEGEDLAGFGLVEPKVVVQPKVRKSDPKTRGKRPQHEWTPMDVAAEFQFRVGRKYPLLPGTLNVKQLSGALAKYRTKFDINALIELELLELFMADEHNFKGIGDEGPYLYKKFLASFSYNMNKARERLGLKSITTVVVDEAPNAPAKVLTASDGRTFHNTITGRAQLQRYETRLKETQNG